MYVLCCHVMLTVDQTVLYANEVNTVPADGLVPNTIRKLDNQDTDCVRQGVYLLSIMGCYCKIT